MKAKWLFHIIKKPQTEPNLRARNKKYTHEPSVVVAAVCAAASMQRDDARMDAISCVLCGEAYQTTEPRTPCILPCFHTFCRQCLVGWGRQAAGADGGFSCPTCRQACSSPAADLQINYALMAVVEAELVCKDATVLTCSDCDDPASSFCDDCGILLCDLHGQAHSRSKQYSSHVLGTVADFKARKQALPKQKRTCTKHRGEPVFCVCACVRVRVRVRVCLQCACVCACLLSRGLLL